ncbi:MAG: MFS transporter [Chloroflexi bacterium]|nr:MAG: MFS transporter [Chloroflexota bacterium]MBL1195256.1 MFS transporter [Chloroflexota bacterium]NOH12542.1 MFS transporter [Chloroflexota bacterium]
MNQPEKQILLTPVLRLFLGTMVLANVAGSMFGFFLPLYLTELGASVTQVGLAFTLASLVPLVLQIFGGYLSDSIGRLQTIAIGSVGGVLGYIGLVFAPTWGWALVAMGLGNVARSMVGPSFASFIAEQSTEENRGRVFGVSEAIFMIVDVIGPPLGGFIAGLYGFRNMLVVAAALYTAAAIIRVWMARNTKFTGDKEPEELSLATLRQKLGSMVAMILGGGIVFWLLITDGARDVAFRLSSELMPLYLEDIGGLTVNQIGILGSMLGIGWMVSTVPAGWLADKRSERVAIIAGFLIQSVSFMVFLNVSSFFGYAVSWFLFGSGIGTMMPAFQSLISKAVPDNLRGTAFGLFQSSLGLISLPAPWIGAQLWTRFTPRLPFYLTAIILMLSAIPAWLKFRIPKEQDPEVLEAKVTATD